MMTKRRNGANKRNEEEVEDDEHLFNYVHNPPTHHSLFFILST